MWADKAFALAFALFLAAASVFLVATSVSTVALVWSKCNEQH